jgi:hypothetical protein
MNFRFPLRRLDALFLIVGGAVFSAALSQPAYAGRPQEQQSSQSQQQSQPPPSPAPAPSAQPASDPAQQIGALPVKRRKVWTNDDVEVLRTPADIYRAEKEAQEAADTEAAAKKAELAKQVKEAGLTMKLPATPGETLRLIKDKEEQIKDLQDVMDRLSHDLQDAPADQKVKIEEQMQVFTRDSQKAQLELKVLQEHLQNLPKPKPDEPPAPPPAAPPAPSAPEKP